jgi:sialic acid synthase SpsE
VTREIKKGTILNLNDITFIRAEKLGLAPDKINEILGKKLLINKLPFDAISEDDIS